LIHRPKTVEEYEENTWEDWGVQVGLVPFDPDEPFPERIIENGICSFAPMFKSNVEDEVEGRLWSVYGSAWCAGQVYSDNGIQGPWVRASENVSLPIGDWSDGGPENMQVTRTRGGLYIMYWAANLLQIENGLAYALSKDGVNWENAPDNADGSIVTSGKAGKFVAPAPCPIHSFAHPARFSRVGYEGQRFHFIFYRVRLE